MLEAMDPWPVNVVLLGKGNTVSEEGLWEQLRAGAAGFKLHEDWGSTPAAIDACLRVCDAGGVQAAIHTDTLNEAGFVESTLAAIGGRTIHAYHTEGAGGGHAPDIIRVAGEPHVLPSSTNPTRPHTRNTIDEHLDMLMVCHHLNPAVPEDLAFAESRIRPSTIAAEDVLHDLGAISMIGSDSQAMGRVGEVVLRTWQTADVGKRRRGSLPGDGRADNHRARRYVAKDTNCPAVAHGHSGLVGSVEPGKLADLVALRAPFFRGPAAPGYQGRHDRLGPDRRPKCFDSYPAAGHVPPDVRCQSVSRTGATSVAFVAPAAIEAGLESRLRTARTLLAVDNTRGLTKADMPENDALPSIEVDPDSFTVSVDGEQIREDPVEVLPMAQRYFLF